MTAAATAGSGEARAPGAVAVAADQPAREDGHGHLEQGKLVLISSVQDAPFTRHLSKVQKLSFKPLES